jgi:hypothetical protein
MPYALIPDGYTLKKVTKAQKDAVNELKRHDDVLAILNNPEIITIVAGIATGALFAKALTEIDLPDVPNWPEVKEKVIEKSKQVSFIASPFGLPLSAARKGAQYGGLSKEQIAEAEKTLRNLLPF